MILFAKLTMKASPVKGSPSKKTHSSVKKDAAGEKSPAKGWPSTSMKVMKSVAGASMKVMKSVAGEKPTKLLVAKPKGQAKAKIPAKSKRWQKLKPQTPEAKPAEVRRRPASSEAKPAAVRRRPASSQAKGSSGDTSLRAHLAPFFGMKTIYNSNDTCHSSSTCSAFDSVCVGG